MICAGILQRMPWRSAAPRGAPTPTVIFELSYCRATAAQCWSKTRFNSLAISAASRCSISLRCIMWTSFPSLNNANEGDDGGYPIKYERARSVASRSWPAKTLKERSGRDPFCKAVRTAGRRRPAAQPQIELTITRVVPCCACSLLSTSLALFNSSTPRRVSSSRMGITIISGYISHPGPGWPDSILQLTRP